MPWRAIMLVLAVVCLVVAAGVSFMRWRAVLPVCVVGMITHPAELYLGADGGFTTEQPAYEAKPVANFVFEYGYTRDWTQANPACWTGKCWKLDVQPVNGALSQAERAEIALLLFKHSRFPLDPAALTLAPAPGETWTSASVRTWNSAATARYIALGWPACLIAGAASFGLAACFIPRKRWAGACPACGYDRKGIAADTVCPECGKAP